MQVTFAPLTPCPASATLNVTVVAFVWLKLDGLAVSFMPARIWVWNRSIGPVVKLSLTMTSSRPNVPSAWILLMDEVCAGGLMDRIKPKPVALVFVRTARMTFFATSYQTTESLPCLPAASATLGGAGAFVEPGTVFAEDAPTFHRLMWEQACVFVATQYAMYAPPPGLAASATGWFPLGAFPCLGEESSPLGGRFGDPGLGRIC